MLRAIPLAALCFLALSGALTGAAATPLPLASQAEADSLGQQVDLRRCYWAEGQRLCTHYDDADHAGFDDDPDFGYYGAPGIYLGFGSRVGPRLHGGTGLRSGD